MRSLGHGSNAWRTNKAGNMFSDKKYYMNIAVKLEPHKAGSLDNDGVDNEL